MAFGGFKKSARALLRTVQGAPLDKRSLSKSALGLSLEPHPPDVLKPSKTITQNHLFIATHRTTSF